jgi:hypothetical protein
VLLTRLSPFVPFNLLNYSFGLIQVRFWTYVFWSWLGMLPGAIFVVVASDAVVRAIARGEVPWFLLCASLVAGIAVAILLVWVRKRLRNNGVRMVRLRKSRMMGADPAEHSTRKLDDSSSSSGSKLSRRTNRAGPISKRSPRKAKCIAIRGG